jgi:hypothetical protein
MSAPPSSVGVSQLSVTCALPAVAVKFLTAPGTVIMSSPVGLSLSQPENITAVVRQAIIATFIILKIVFVTLIILLVN